MFGSFSLIVNLKATFLAKKLFAIFTIFNRRFTLALLTNYYYVTFWIIVDRKLYLNWLFGFLTLFIIYTRLSFDFWKAGFHMQTAAINAISFIAAFASKIHQCLSFLITILITLDIKGYFIHRFFRFSLGLASLVLSRLIWNIP